MTGLYHPNSKKPKARNRVLAAIRKNPFATTRQLQEATKINSVAVLDYHLKSLIEEGKISKGPRFIVHENKQ